MKRLLAGFVAVLFVAPLAVSAQTPRPADRPARDINADRPAWRHGVSLDIIGTRIKNAEGKDLGEVEQLLIDPKSGNVRHVVIGLGGLAGVGEKKVVVPWSDLRFAGAGKGNAITMDQAKLERAPRYDRSARADAPPAASPRTPADSPVKDSDKDGKSNRTDKAPLDPTRKQTAGSRQINCHPAGPLPPGFTVRIVAERCREDIALFGSEFGSAIDSARLASGFL